MARGFENATQPYTPEDRAHQLDDLDERRILRQWIPDGRILDEADLKLVMDQGEVWAPFTVRRQMLIEYGAANVGERMKLTPQELLAFREWVREMQQKHSTPWSAAAAGEKNPVKPFEGLRRV